MPRAAAIAAVLACLLPAPLAAAPAPDDATIARNLAENVLGRGQVRVSRISNGGRTLEITWESATFKASNPPAHTRDLLQTEAQFVAESVFRVLTGVRDMDFEIVQGRRSLCAGRASRDRPFRVTFAKDLNG